jgi:Tfp pilus assembly protein PilF
LYVGLGYTRLAREEFVWAKQSFERALVLDPEHEDGLVGLGEALLRFGEEAEAIALFRKASETCRDDLDLMMTMGRALYRERIYGEAKDVFETIVSQHTDSAEAAAAYAYVLHRLEDETGARRQLRRALHLDPDYHEARIYLGLLLYDRGDWAGAAREFERVPMAEHFDSLAVWRLIELKRSLTGTKSDNDVVTWEKRLEELESDPDPIEEMLAEIEAAAETDAASESECDSDSDSDDTSLEEMALVVRREIDAHRLQLPDGGTYTGTWQALVEKICNAKGEPGESVAQFMQRHAAEAHARMGVALPAEDPKEFLMAGERAGYWQIEY